MTLARLNYQEQFEQAYTGHEVAEGWKCGVKQLISIEDTPY
jgi:hypothetical protein